MKLIKTGFVKGDGKMESIIFRKTIASIIALFFIMCEILIAQGDNNPEKTSNTSSENEVTQSLNVKPGTQEEETKSSATNTKEVIQKTDVIPGTQQEEPKSSSTKENQYELQKFEVTGTHIKRIDFEGPSPLLVIDRDEIDISGASTVNELLSKLTMNNGLLLNENRTQATSPGASGINLRGLGQDGTLILVNGRRFTSYPFAFNISDSFVDLNSIPLSAVEKVEVLKDGASALYGSDAIAGVVNIILRKNFEHSEISQGYGVSDQGDANEVDINYITGKSTDNSNLTFALNYFKRESFLLGDRDFSSHANQTLKHPTDGFDWTTIDNDPANYFDFITADPACFGLTACSGFFNPNPYITAIPETERLGGLFTYNREISLDMNFFSEVMLSQVTTNYQSAPTPIQGDILMLPGPNNPEPGPILLFWRVTDAGPRYDDVVTDTYRVVAGLDGVVNDWDWTAAIHRSVSESKETGRNYISLSAMDTAINTGVINPFGVNQPEVMDTVKRTIQREGESVTQGFDGKFVGEVSQLESGPVTLAIGMEYRDEAISDIPDALVVSDDIIGKTGTSVDADRDITAGFIEVNVPVSNDVELQLAARIENYSDFGTTTNPKLAVRYKPTDKLMFRASAGTGFRAPSLPQLYSQTTAFKQLSDTTRLNSCLGAGFPPAACAGLTTGVYTVNLSGNKELEPEDSKSIYLGLVYEPVNGVTISVDYWNYTQENIIEDNTQFVLDNESSFPGDVIRGGPAFWAGDPGGIIEINDTFRNYAEQETDGIDVELLFNWKTTIGKVSLRNLTSKLLSFEKQDVDNGPTNDLAGTYRIPELRNTTTITLERENYSVALTGNYLGEYEDAWNGIIDNHVVSSLTTYNLQYAYTAIQDMKFTAGINNLTDKDPPFSNADYLGFDSSLHSPVGRFYYIKLNHQF